MSQYPYQGQDPNQPSQYGGYTPNTGGGQPPQMPYGQPPYSQPQQQPPYGQAQPPYNQAPYSESPYSQPQIPYGQVPYGQTASKMSFHPAYLTAGIGAIVAFIAFFLPYVSYSSVLITLSASGPDIGGQLWLEFFISLAAIAIVALLQFGKQWFGKSPANSFFGRIATSLTTLPRAWSIGLLSIGILGLFDHVLLMVGGKYTAYTSSGAGWGIGFWLYLLGFIAVIVGGVLAVRPSLLSNMQQKP